MKAVYLIVGIISGLLALLQIGGVLHIVEVMHFDGKVVLILLVKLTLLAIFGALFLFCNRRWKDGGAPKAAEVTTTVEGG